jgi:hypothetical protein
MGRVRNTTRVRINARLWAKANVKVRARVRAIFGIRIGFVLGSELRLGFGLGLV